MLIQFTVANFGSFKDPSTLSMLASKRKSKNANLDAEATFTPLSDQTLLKVAAIYGANGSGKSTISNALAFMKRLVLESSKESQAGEKIAVKPHKLSSDIEGRASDFEIIFIQSKTIYQYEFSADETAIRSEKLTMQDSKSNRDVTLFSRSEKGIELGKRFSEGRNLEKKTRANSLFLSVCANFDGPISTDILKWFNRLKIVSGLDDSALLPFTLSRLQDPTWNRKITTLVSTFDLGIEKLEAATLEVSPDSSEAKHGEADQRRFSGPRLSSFHNRFNEHGEVDGIIPFDFKKDESQGTQKLISMAGPIIATLENEFILVIDEFDARLHPILNRNILSLFNSKSNDKNAQLIVMTHDTNLLDKDLLRRDQVWLVEKDLYGGSHLHSLVEYKIRNDASFEKDYMSGKYGAIPFIGDIKRVVESRRAPNKKKSPES